MWWTTIPEWMFGGIISLAAVAFTASGVWLGHILSTRVQRRATEVQALANAKSNEQELIDQLQEELSLHRNTATSRANAQDERMERIERQNELVTEQRDLLRSYAHDLRGHIFDGRPPPPPDWPPGIDK